MTNQTSKQVFFDDAAASLDAYSVIGLMPVFAPGQKHYTSAVSRELEPGRLLVASPGDASTTLAVQSGIERLRQMYAIDAEQVKHLFDLFLAAPDLVAVAESARPIIRQVFGSRPVRLKVGSDPEIDATDELWAIVRLSESDNGLDLLDQFDQLWLRHPNRNKSPNFIVAREYD